ncbi:MAG TPA: 50S ribosomal protein L20 [Firmicutes bacterium]|nr:50S ribosomal protein L20 [Bacillota bacterium]
MTRVKTGYTRRRRHKKVLAATKGYRGARGTRHKAAKEAMIKAGVYAYRDRRNLKRDFRRLWIVRVNAACREAGLTYSQFIKALKDNNIQLNRKVLAEIAVRHPDAFRNIVSSVQHS